MSSDSYGGVVEEEDGFPGQFKKLEDKIETLVRTCRDLQNNKSELEAKIYDLEGSVKTRVAAEQEYAEEKSMIRSKVDNLLSRLDQVLESK
jgi:peptidoglycan hydrolase CwlO-like protein